MVQGAFPYTSDVEQRSRAPHGIAVVLGEFKKGETDAEVIEAVHIGINLAERMCI